MLKSIIQNKSLPFLIIRNLTYFVTFIKINLLATELGEYDYGIWGFIKLIWQYLSFITIGLHFAVNVLIASNKSNSSSVKEYANTAITVVMTIGLALIVIAGVISASGLNLFPKYNISKLFVAVIAVGLLKNINIVNINIDRNFNSLYSIALYYLLSELIILPILFIFPSDILLTWIVYTTLIIEFVFLLLFIIRRPITFKFSLTKKPIAELFKRGTKLLIYNYSLILMFLSVRTIVANFYTVEEFGEYSFVNSIVDALFIAFSSIIWVFFPKMITKFSSINDQDILPTIYQLRKIYLPLLFFALLTVGYCVFIVNHFFPNYNSFPVLFIFMLISLGMRDYAFGFNMLLIAKNYEMVLAKTALVAIVLNTLMTFVLGWFAFPLKYIPFITIIASFLYSIIAIKRSYSFIIPQSKLDIFRSDWKIILPVIMIIGIILLEQLSILSYTMVFIFYGILNLKHIRFALINSFSIFTQRNV